MEIPSLQQGLNDLEGPNAGGLPSNYVPQVKLEVKYLFLLEERAETPVVLRTIRVVSLA